MDKSDLHSSIKNREMVFLKDYCLTNNISRKTTKRLVRQMAFQQEKSVIIDPIDTMNHLPANLVYNLIAGSQKCIDSLYCYNIFRRRWSFNDKSISEILVFSKPYFVDAGEWLYSEGNLSMDVYFLNTGVLSEIIMNPNTQKEVVADQIHPMSMFGLEGLRGSLRMSSVLAFSYSWGIFIRSESLITIAESDKALNDAIMDAYSTIVASNQESRNSFASDSPTHTEKRAFNRLGSISPRSEPMLAVKL